MEQQSRTSIPIGAEVIALNGETIGVVHVVHPHYFLVERTGVNAGGDVEVPTHAVAELTGAEGTTGAPGQVRLSVNLGALTEVLDESQTAAHRLHEE